MRRNLIVVVLVLAGMFALPASAHSTHSHNCHSVSHGYQNDGGGWRHGVVHTDTTGYDTSTVYHQQWLAAKQMWASIHQSTYWCAN